MINYYANHASQYVWIYNYLLTDSTTKRVLKYESQIAPLMWSQTHEIGGCPDALLTHKILRADGLQISTQTHTIFNNGKCHHAFNWAEEHQAIFFHSFNSMYWFFTNIKEVMVNGNA